MRTEAREARTSSTVAQKAPKRRGRGHRPSPSSVVVHEAPPEPPKPIQYPYIWYPPEPIPPKNQAYIEARRETRQRREERRQREIEERRAQRIEKLLRRTAARRAKVQRDKQDKELAKRLREEVRQARIEARARRREQEDRDRENAALRRQAMRLLETERRRQEESDFKEWQKNHREVMSSLEPGYGPTTAPDPALLHLDHDQLDPIAPCDFDAPYGIYENAEEIDQIIEEELGPELPIYWWLDYMVNRKHRWSERPCDLPTID
jgi:hypothetical protein